MNDAPSSSMSTKRRRTGQSSSRSGAAREPQQQQLPDDIEKENAAVLDKLPREVWERILDSLGQDDLFPFALTCRYFRDLRLGAVTAANDSKSRWRTVMRTELKTYTYIQTSEDVVYLPTIEEVFYDGMLSVSADYVKWLFREARSAYCREAALAKGRRYDGIGWQDAAEGAEWGERDVMELAAIRGDLDLIKWLRSQDPPCEWNKKACIAAASANRWDLLRHLLSMGCPLDKENMLGAVACDPNDWRRGPYLLGSWDGKFEILKWLAREHGCAFRGYWKHAHVREVVKAAVRHHDLECLQWVRAQGLNWDDIVFGGTSYEDGFRGLNGEFDFETADVCNLAAKSGSLEILQYAVEGGCEWLSTRCLHSAEKNKHCHVVNWIRDGFSDLLQRQSDVSRDWLGCYWWMD